MGTQYGGMLFHGDKYTLMCGYYGISPRIIPESKMKEVGEVESKVVFAELITEVRSQVRTLSYRGSEANG